jgi:hypothetical protein
MVPAWMHQDEAGHDSCGSPLNILEDVYVGKQTVSNDS